MKAKLIKLKEGYTLNDVEGNPIGQTFGRFKGRKLSLKNCQAIENGYDLDELACKEIRIDISVVKDIDAKRKENSSPCIPLNEGGCVGSNLYNQVKGFEKGFQKALELMGDKKFSEKDMIMFGLFCRNNHISECLSVTDELFPKYQSLQQTEWDVEIEMRPASLVYKSDEMLPKLDTDGCLILKTFKSE